MFRSKVKFTDCIDKLRLIVGVGLTAFLLWTFVMAKRKFEWFWQTGTRLTSRNMCLNVKYWPTLFKFELK